MQLTACTADQLAMVREVEDRIRRAPQVYIPVDESLHEGVYTRVAHVPANIVLTGALMKVPTTLLIFGWCVLTRGDHLITVNGFAGFKASAGRKTVFRTYGATDIVMSFATKAKSLEEARKEFTDDKLQEKSQCQVQ